MNIHLINLDRTPERLESFRRINSHVKNLTRFSAVDGTKIDREALIANGILTRDVSPTYTNGALGNALSHIELWKMAAQSGRPLTTLEDDAIVHRSFDEAAPQVLSNLPSDWDIILWGWNFDAGLIFDLLPGVSACAGKFFEEDLRRGWRNFQDLPIRPQPFRLFAGFGVVCYSVSSNGAKELIKRTLPIRKVAGKRANSGIDVSMNDIYSSLNAFVCFPPLVITPNDLSVSTFQTG